MDVYISRCTRTAGILLRLLFIVIVLVIFIVIVIVAGIFEVEYICLVSFGYLWLWFVDLIRSECVLFVSRSCYLSTFVNYYERM